MADTSSFSGPLSLSSRIDLWVCLRDERELRLVVAVVKVGSRVDVYICTLSEAE